MRNKPTPGYLVGDGRIIWQIGVGIPFDLDEVARRCLSQMGIGTASHPLSWQMLLDEWPRVREWFLRLPLDNFLFSALTAIVPFLSEADLAFPRVVLNLDTWRRRAQYDPAISEETRALWLKMVDGCWIPKILHNAMLHLFAVLANNHFEEIRSYLSHSLLVGTYTHLMPHYLFAVLFAKVSVLLQFARTQEVNLHSDQ